VERTFFKATKVSKDKGPWESGAESLDKKSVRGIGEAR